MSKIRIMNGPYRGREKTLGEKALTIGRDAEAGIQILDRSASRFHAEIFPVGGMFFVRDLESKNGTYINDERLGDEELLREGDIIKIGTTEIRATPFRTSAQRTTPRWTALRTTTSGPVSNLHHLPRPVG